MANLGDAKIFEPAEVHRHGFHTTYSQLLNFYLNSTPSMNHP